MRFRTFGDHNAYCERLHAELRKAGIQIEQKEQLFCATSTKLEEYPRRFAMHFDCLTFEPLSTKHSVWLDFRKPLSTGVDNFLERIRPHGQPVTAFPHGLDAAGTRRGNAESLHEWFLRLLDKHCGNDPARVAVEDGIAIFANFAWTKDRLTFASMPTLVVTDGTLEDFYLHAARPVVYTPACMPVGTQGTIKGVLPDHVAATGSQIILANTYDVMLRPGEQVVADLGGLQRFMGWQGPDQGILGSSSINST
jgi:hypothetical protein